jgi:hypothetical protein
MESIANSTTVLIEKGILAQLTQLALEPAKSAISLQNIKLMRVHTKINEKLDR